MKRSPFDWDDEKAKANLQKHGIPFEEAESVFDNPLAATFKDAEHSIEEDRWIITGHSKLGQLLVICFIWRGETLRIINARKATNQEAKEYEKGKEKETDEMLDEYHFDYSKAEWGKFAGKVKRTKSAVYIDPEVASAFPNSDAVNQALKQVILLSKLPIKSNGSSRRRKLAKPPVKKDA